jgi:hypothetical protein
LFDESELENSQMIQAQGYDRSFIVSGPVIKVFKDADHEDSQLRRLALDMTLPVLRNDDGDIIRPANLMLHNNES